MTWEDVGDRWPDRLAVLAPLIPAGAAVIDLGAGAQGLRALLDPACTYTPADRVLRSSDCLGLDLDRDVWPVGRWDVAVMAGALEYAADPARAFVRLRELARSALVTYSHGGGPRARALFANHLAPAELTALAVAAGWTAQPVASWRAPGLRQQTVWSLR